MKPRFVLTAILLGALLFDVTDAFAQKTTCVSVDSSGDEGNGRSDRPAISADGRFVAFVSEADDLVDGDTNGVPDVFVHDCVTGVTERVSVDSSGAQGDGYCSNLTISADGRFVVFASSSSNLVSGDTNGGYDVFLHDRTTGLTERISVDSSGREGNDWSGWSHAAISADGRYVAFDSSASNLVSGDANGHIDVFVRDRTAGTTERVSVDSSGGDANGTSSNPAISADGNLVSFASDADDLVAGDTNHVADAFVRDRLAGTTVRVSVSSTGIEGDGASGPAGMSADGRFVAMLSDASNLVEGDGRPNVDAFVHDRLTGITERVNVSTSGAADNGSVNDAAISADGRFVAFTTYGTNLVDDDMNGWPDVFIHDRSTGITALVSLSSSGAQANGSSATAAISSNGQFVAFSSLASNLGGGAPNNILDVFLRDRGVISSWSNYGDGFPGTIGVPAFTAASDPALGVRFSLDLSNSFTDYTVGALFVGFRQMTLHSTWGGDLLVDPAITQLIGISPWGAVVSGDVPDDDALVGMEIDLQTFELDPGAARGVSFTPGLQLILGH